MIYRAHTIFGRLRQRAPVKLLLLTAFIFGLALLSAGADAKDSTSAEGYKGSTAKYGDLSKLTEKDYRKIRQPIVDKYLSTNCGYINADGFLKRTTDVKTPPECVGLANDLLDMEASRNAKQAAAPVAVAPKSASTRAAAIDKVYKTYEGYAGGVNPDYVGKTAEQLKNLHDIQLAAYISSDCGYNDQNGDLHRYDSKTNDDNCQTIAKKLLDINAAKPASKPAAVAPVAAATVVPATTPAAGAPADPVDGDPSGQTTTIAKGNEQGNKSNKARVDSHSVDSKVSNDKSNGHTSDNGIQKKKSDNKDKTVNPADCIPSISNGYCGVAKIGGVDYAAQDNPPPTSVGLQPEPQPEPPPAAPIAAEPEPKAPAAPAAEAPAAPTPPPAEAAKSAADTSDACADLVPYKNRDYKGSYEACMKDTKTLQACLASNEEALADAKDDKDTVNGASYTNNEIEKHKADKKAAAQKVTSLTNRSASLKDLLASLKSKCGALSDACQKFNNYAKEKYDLEKQSQAAWSDLLNSSAEDKETNQVKFDFFQKELKRVEDGKRVNEFNCNVAKGTVQKGDTSGICGHASLFSSKDDDTGLQGQNCQNAADTVQATQAVAQAADALATSGVTIASQVITMSNNGSQQSSVDAQKQLMITQGTAEIGRATVNAGNATALGIAAAKANYSKEAMQQAMAECQKDPNCDTETYRNLQRGAQESERQAQAALSQSFMSTLAAASQGVIAAFSFKAANDYKAKDQTGASNGGVAVSMPIGAAGTTTAVGTPINTVKTDSTTPDSNVALAPVPGQVKSGLAGGSPMTAAANSTAAMGTNPGGGGGGGGIGGGGGSAGNSGDKNKGGGKRLGNTAVGDMAGGSGGAVARNSIAGGLGKDSGPDTALTDAIKSLMGGGAGPGGADAAKKEEGRGLASTKQDQQGFEESYAVPSTVSIFQQVSSKYRQLSNNGQI